MAKKVLIIDDDIDLVETNRAFLTRNGFQVSYAYNGIEGLQKALQERPDIIILDVMMDEVGEGFEVAREIRRQEEIQNVKILMLTGVNKEHDFNLQIGPDDVWNPVDLFVEKPFGHQDLLKKIHELIGNAE